MVKHGIDASFSISNCCADLADIPVAYQQALESSKYIVFDRNCRFFSYSNITSVQSCKDNEIFESLLREFRESISNAIIYANREDCCRIIDKYIEMLTPGNCKPDSVVKYPPLLKQYYMIMERCTGNLNWVGANWYLELIFQTVLQNA